MLLRDRIERLKAGKKPPKDVLVGNIVSVMRELHIGDINIIRKMPMSSYFVIVEQMLKDQKEQEKEKKKGERKSKLGRN